MGVTAEGGHDDYTPRPRVRFAERLFLQACRHPGLSALPGAGNQRKGILCLFRSAPSSASPPRERTMPDDPPFVPDASLDLVDARWRLALRRA